MASSDPVGDMIAMIKNAYTRRHRRVALPHSRMKEGVCRVLFSEGYLDDVKVEAGQEGQDRRFLHLFLKYDPEGSPALSEIKRVSRPGCRIFRGVQEFGKVLDGLGVSVLSTSKGILSDRQARKMRVGGELLCRAW
jgi:small subunit ribosomal protein S8